MRIAPGIISSPILRITHFLCSEYFVHGKYYELQMLHEISWWHQCVSPCSFQLS